jgi:hypothetical protein
MSWSACASMQTCTGCWGVSPGAPLRQREANILNAFAEQAASYRQRQAVQHLDGVALQTAMAEVRG